MQGKLVHTNEILVLLGDNWFVEKSAKQACDLIDRRLVNIDNYLQDLDKEEKKIADQMKWTGDLMQVEDKTLSFKEREKHFKILN